MPVKNQTSILIVDDHPLVRFGLRAALQASYPGIEVEECTALAEALGRADSAVPDAIILDLALPDSSGVETYLSVQRQYPCQPIIIVTGSDPDELRAWPEIEGATAVLSKASGPEAIIDILAELMAQVPETDPGSAAPAVTPRERDILILCARGLPNKVIGRSLGISENTVRVHLVSVFKRFGLSHRGEVKDFLDRSRIR